jgi:uncharacterized protein YunC (DUF1805 family)
MLEFKLQPVRIGDVEGIWAKVHGPFGSFMFVVAGDALLTCGAFDAEVLDHFGFLMARVRGTEAHPLKEFEDMLKAKVDRFTSKAGALGVVEGISGLEALERMLRKTESPRKAPSSLEKGL